MRPDGPTEPSAPPLPAAAAVTRAGMVAVIGAPNAGKSTLLNALVGERLAIATPKPQTTRDNLLGVCHRPGAQIGLVDTPGIHEPGRRRLNQAMVREALSALDTVDVVLHVIDAERQCGAEGGARQEEDERVAGAIADVGLPAVLALNKVDRTDKAALLPVIAAWAERGLHRAYVPISARRRDGLDRLLDEVVALLPAGPALFEDDMLTDRPLRYLAAERIRERVFMALGDELPYHCAVEIESWKERGPMVEIAAAIHVAREPHKRIVVGKGGRQIKAIGIAARESLQVLLERRVDLRLFVHVEPGWSDRPAALSRFGYRAGDPEGQERG